MIGPLLNGLVNYEYWLPVPGLVNQQIDAMIAAYQFSVQEMPSGSARLLCRPLAYSQLAGIWAGCTSRWKPLTTRRWPAIREAPRSRRWLVPSPRQGGGWAHPRVLTVQFRNIERNDILESANPTPRRSSIHPKRLRPT